MTLKNIKHHEDFRLVEDSDEFEGFRPVSDVRGGRKKKHGTAHTDIRSQATRELKDREALVGQMFNSKRVSVSGRLQDRPQDVMKGAAELQSFLLKYSRT